MKTRRSLVSYCPRQTRLNLGTINLICSQFAPSHSLFSPAPAWALSHGPQSFRKYLSALVWSPPRATGDICSSAWSTASDLGTPSVVSHSSFSLLLCLCGIFCPFLNMFPRHPTSLAPHRGHTCSPPNANTLTPTPNAKN